MPGCNVDLCQPGWVLVQGTSMPWFSAEWRCSRPEIIIIHEYRKWYERSQKPNSTLPHRTCSTMLVAHPVASKQWRNVGDLDLNIVSTVKKAGNIVDFCSLLWQSFQSALRWWIQFTRFWSTGRWIWKIAWRNSTQLQPTTSLASTSSLRMAAALQSSSTRRSWTLPTLRSRPYRHECLVSLYWSCGCISNAQLVSINECCTAVVTIVFSFMCCIAFCKVIANHIHKNGKWICVEYYSSWSVVDCIHIQLIWQCPICVSLQNMCRIDVGNAVCDEIAWNQGVTCRCRPYSLALHIQLVFAKSILDVSCVVDHRGWQLVLSFTVELCRYVTISDDIRCREASYRGSGQILT